MTARASVASMKATAPRRVWRMSSESLLVELVPEAESSAGSEWANEHAGASSLGMRTAATAPLQPRAAVESEKFKETHRCSASAAQHPADNAREASPLKLRVLRPAHVESWQSSSFDLLSGLQVRDVTDTIAGCVFEELFKDKRTED